MLYELKSKVVVLDLDIIICKPPSKGQYLALPSFNSFQLNYLSVFECFENHFISAISGWILPGKKLGGIDPGHVVNEMFVLNPLSTNIDNHQLWLDSITNSLVYRFKMTSNKYVY